MHQLARFANRGAAPDSATGKRPLAKLVEPRGQVSESRLWRRAMSLSPGSRRLGNALAVFDEFCRGFQDDADGDVQNSLAVAYNNARGIIK